MESEARELSREHHRCITHTFQPDLPCRAQKQYVLLVPTRACATRNATVPGQDLNS